MLAGGKGTRLRPLTIHTPKPIVPIFERPFLHYPLDLLTQVPGSSACYVGGFVTYADRAKVALIGVDPDLLATEGAVSAPVARAMAEGARERLGTDLAVAVTGIAGPDGGTPTKPVGLTFVAVSTADGTEVRRCVWTGERDANKAESARTALAMLLAAAERAPAHT